MSRCRINTPDSYTIACICLAMIVIMIKPVGNGTILIGYELVEWCKALNFLFQDLNRKIFIPSINIKMDT